MPPRTEATPPPAEPPGRGVPPDPDGPTEAELAEARRQILGTPVELLVANHCYGLFELAALHLSNQPANFDAARLAIDAMGAMVESLGGRLGEAEEPLRDGLAQIRLAFVQLQAAGGPERGGPD